MALKRLAGPAGHVSYMPDPDNYDSNDDCPDVVVVEADALEALEESEDSLASSIARLHSSDSRHRKAAKTHYEARRRLENAIRRHTTGACGCRNQRACLSALARIVPVKPRPKYGKRIKVKAAK